MKEMPENVFPWLTSPHACSALSPTSWMSCHPHSGTNDTAMLMPLCVEQQESPHPELRGTNGKMLAHLVGKHTEVVEPPSVPNSSLATVLLQLTVEGGRDALVDTGAYMAGLTNREVARQLKKVLMLQPEETRRHKGVTFFDATASPPAWVILALDGREWLRASSPIPERDTVVYYDESQCRGADLVLAPSAVAVLTVSSGMCMDTLMQGAGRLRGLDYGQRIHLAVSKEVASIVKHAMADGPDGGDVLSVPALLEFVLANTVTAIRQVCHAALLRCPTGTPLLCAPFRCPFHFCAA